MKEEKNIKKKKTRKIEWDHTHKWSLKQVGPP